MNLSHKQQNDVEDNAGLREERKRTHRNIESPLNRTSQSCLGIANEKILTFLLRAERARESREYVMHHKAKNAFQIDL